MACGHLLFPTCGCAATGPSQATSLDVETFIRKYAESFGARSDSWSSAITGIGTDERDKRRSHNFGPGVTLSYQQIAYLWERDDITAKAIEELPAACFAEGYELTIGDEGKYGSLKEDIEDQLLELAVDEAIETAMQYERAYGGGAILLGTSDYRRMQEPLRENSGSLDYLNVLEPMEIIPDSTYGDPHAPKYGKTEFYRINSISSATGQPTSPNGKRKATANRLFSNNLVHESRLISFGGIKVSRFLPSSSSVSPFWGSPFIYRFFEAMRDFSVSYAGAGLLAVDVSQPVIMIDGLKDAAAKDDGRLRARMAALELGRSLARAILLDAKTEKFERQTTNLTGIPELLDRLALRLSAAIGMPLSVLLGYSPATLGAPGEGELELWHGKIRSTQRRRLTPILIRLIKMIIRSLRERKIPKKLGVKWRELKHQTEAQVAESRLTQARTDSMYIKAGVASPDEIRRSRFTGEYSYETQVEESKKAPGFLAPLPAGVLPGSTPAAAAKPGAKPGAPATMGPNAHSVGGYARRNPTGPALGANPKQGGDVAPRNRDSFDDTDITVALEELAYQRARRATLSSSGRLTAGMATLLDYAERMAIAELELMGVRVDSDGGGHRRRFAEFEVVVETPRGAVRKWVDSDGTAGETRMKYDYGYFVGSRGTDGDSVDVYIGPSETAEWVYVVHQQKKSSGFAQYDEDKVMLGFDSANHARDAYLRQYDDERFFGGMSQMRVDEFRVKLAALLACKISHTDESPA